MENLPDILSDPQKEELRELLQPLDCFSQEGMTAQYIISNTFIDQIVV